MPAARARSGAVSMRSAQFQRHSRTPGHMALSRQATLDPGVSGLGANLSDDRDATRGLGAERLPDGHCCDVGFADVHLRATGAFRWIILLLVWIAA